MPAPSPAPSPAPLRGPVVQISLGLGRRFRCSYLPPQNRQNATWTQRSLKIRCGASFNTSKTCSAQDARLEVTAYREAVPFQSPGSPRYDRIVVRGAPWVIVRPAPPIRRRRYTTGTWLCWLVIVSALGRRCGHLCNAFGVCACFGIRNPGCALRLRRGATLGSGMELVVRFSLSLISHITTGQVFPKLVNRLLTHERMREIKTP